MIWFVHIQCFKGPPEIHIVLPTEHTTWKYRMNDTKLNKMAQ